MGNSTSISRRPNEDEKDYLERHDFGKISQADLDEAFVLLRKRSSSWKLDYEKRATELHKLFMTLRGSETVGWIDPKPKFSEPADLSVESKDDNWVLAELLMTNPGLWNMWSRKSAQEFHEILRHLTRFAPFKGRPFIRAWLEALLPCLCRWVLLSSTGHKDGKSGKSSIEVLTLKHFLGAFGQPGIAVCLKERGAPMLKTLQNAARSVEATEQGDVEEYYWKRLTESSFRGNSGWGKLAKVENVPLTLSQLDCLPVGWLQDAGDHANVFAWFVSKEITPLFETLVKDTVMGKANANVQIGPAKTLSRSLAKGHEYMTEFQNEGNAVKKNERWTHFGKKFQEVFKRAPNKPSDFSWNIMDFARCSIEVPSASDALVVKELVEDRFKVVSVKNGYNSDVTVKGSGYRDTKLLVEAEFEGLRLNGIPNMEKKTVFICEIQIVCKAWLINKNSTSLSYKIMRSITLKDLCNDFEKYVFEDQDKIEIETEDVIKNGWFNLSKNADFSAIDGEKILFDAGYEGWHKDSVIIVSNAKKLNLEAIDWFNKTLLGNAAHYGNLEVLQGLLDVRCFINGKDKDSKTALHWACDKGNESCVRALLDAGIDTNIHDYKNRTALDLTLQRWKEESRPVHRRIERILRGEKLPPQKNSVGLVRLRQEILSNTLTNFLDSHSVSTTVMSQLICRKRTCEKLENIMQALWFGADVEARAMWQRTAILQAAEFGPTQVVAVLIEYRANIEAKDKAGKAALHLAAENVTLAENGTLVSLATIALLIDKGANIKAKTHDGRTPIHIAAEKNSKDVFLKLIEFGADMWAKDKKGRNALWYTEKNLKHGSSIAEVLRDMR
jgi:ankyrin repeat protein